MKHIETLIERECCNYARKLGIASIKLEKNGNKGVPDRLFIKEGGECFFVEFKRSAKEKPSVEQVVWLEWIGSDKSAVIYDLDTFINLDFFKQ